MCDVFPEGDSSQLDTVEPCHKQSGTAVLGLASNRAPAGPITAWKEGPHPDTASQQEDTSVSKACSAVPLQGWFRRTQTECRGCYLVSGDAAEEEEGDGGGREDWEEEAKEGRDIGTVRALR